jgi:ubiquinone/menaquinone biosynthesis C-methylase UbiE
MMNFEQLRNSCISRTFNNLTTRWAGNKWIKKTSELFYWRLKKWEEGEFSNNHFRFFYTRFFDLEESFYHDKSVLDIGCGPRGSLEWIAEHAHCTGLDPLADRYRKLTGKTQKMHYVTGNCESIPFGPDSFDVVSAFNSLDHVDDLSRCCGEIIRVLKPGGLLLLIVDIHDQATLTEPIIISWDFLELFQPALEIISENHFEGHRMYKSLRQGIPFDHRDPTRRYGILTAKLIKTPYK